MLDGIRDRVNRAADWLNRQWTGTVRRSKAMWNWATFDRLIPPSIADQIQNFLSWGWAASGLRGSSRKDQLRAAVILGFFAVVSSLISLGLTLGFVILFGLLGVVALARNIPAVNGAWSRLADRAPVKSDYDIPRWHRD